jgi:hypothetical protein
MGWVGGAERVKPISEESEQRIVQALGQDLLGLKVKVSSNIDCSRGTGSGSKAKYAVIGGSNARKTAEALKRQGREVLAITEGGWRINNESVEGLVRRVQKEVDSSWIVVFQMLDNSVYYVEGEDGEYYLPRKGDDGKYHVDGSLHLANPSRVSKTIKKVLPVLHALKPNKKLIFAPQARYLVDPCCGAPTHCNNLLEQDYRRRMLERISGIRRELKDICYDERVTSYRVSNPCGMLGFYDNTREKEAETNRGTDPVHLANPGYDTLALGIIQQVEMESSSFNGGKRELEEEDELSQMMRSSLARRRDWIYNTGVAGSWRGGQRGRYGGPGSSRGRGGYGGSR